ncbi:DNA-binding anti-repressor SinI [Pontibacillus halophilus]|nr:DNA-binding anti-repressor SinI [Pontibacillus halophilus]
MDKENEKQWVLLLKEAKQLGLTVDEVKDFLNEKKNHVVKCKIG